MKKIFLIIAGIIFLGTVDQTPTPITAKETIEKQK